jgi:hypothetical protein
MAHYAFLDENNIVTEVITGIDETETIGGLDTETWYGNFRGLVCKRTSYNGNIRKIFAQVGGFYDEENDRFLPAKREGMESFIFNEEELKEMGYKVFSVEQASGSTMLNNLNFEVNDKIAVIFGNEVTGVEQTTIQQSEGCIEIPQFGMKHSLNISTAAGVVMWELVRNRKHPSTSL